MLLKNLLLGLLKALLLSNLISLNLRWTAQARRTLRRRYAAKGSAR